MLPDSYRAFLLKHNGGRPVPEAFPIRGMKDNPVGSIHSFLGVDQRIESNNLMWTHQTLKHRLPPNLLAVAYTDTGDSICISLFGKDKGAVVLWDIQNEPQVPSYANVYFVADDFQTFLDTIHPYEG